MRVLTTVNTANERTTEKFSIKNMTALTNVNIIQWIVNVGHAILLFMGHWQQHSTQVVPSGPTL